MPNLQIAEYVGYEVAEHLDGLTLLVAKKTAELRALGGPVNDATAQEMDRAFVELVEGLEQLSLNWSVLGTEILRTHERESRIRPDTLGQGGPRLGDYLFVDPILAAPGSIGVANEDELDAHVPWWPTNEFGSTTQADEGRVLFGVFFEPGPETRPSGDNAGEHAIFQARGRGEYRGSGIVTKPIAPKQFIRSAWQEISQGWTADLTALYAKFVGQIP